MPLTLRPKDALLDTILSSILAGKTASDISPISVIRQLSEGVAATQADLSYDLWTLLQGWYLTTAEGQDLDIRGRDYGRTRDSGQAASDPVLFTKTPLWVDDIALPAPQVVQATLLDGTVVLYRSLGDHVLLPAGRSVSGPAPGSVLAAGVNDGLSLNLDGDGVRSVTLGAQSSAVAIAAAIQAAVRALAPLDPARQPAYTTFRCDYGGTTAGLYTLRSGTAGPSSSVVVSVAASADASHTLKLGISQGGTEQVGQDSVSVPVLCDRLGVIGNVGAGQIHGQAAPVPGILAVANPLMFSNGREAASDDAYRQDVRNYILALGRGTRDALERAVAQTVGADGQRHVMTSQCVSGVGTTSVFLCDGRSLTVGAQGDVIRDVQDELDGLGQAIGGWVADGNTAGVVSATVLTVDVSATVRLGPTPDLARTKAVLSDAVYQFLYGSAVGQGMSYAELVTLIDQRTAEMLGVSFIMPAAFSTNPPNDIGGAVGIKLMPGIIDMNVVRA